MKRQGIGNREQGTGNRESVRLKELLRKAVPKIDADAEPVHDLWPVLAARIREDETRRDEPVAVRVPWYDWALMAGLLFFVAVVPAMFPVLLYYL